ncbi:MAG: hypothetical protein GY861_02680 [bacterium]|nr:hypothetical protein [bacterium]
MNDEIIDFYKERQAVLIRQNENLMYDQKHLIANVERLTELNEELIAENKELREENELRLCA